MRDLARRLHAVARTHAEERRATYRATVTGVGPMTLDVIGADVTLDDEDFDLSQWVRRYDAKYGIDVDDTVILLRDDGDWIVTDVLADKSVSGP